MIIDSIPRKSDTLKFGQFLNNYADYPITIPNDYQREYAWTTIRKDIKKSPLQVFLEDFYEAYSGEDKYFMFGDNICIGEDPKHNIYEMADGQQRITSCFIMGIVLSKMLDNKKYYERFFLERTGKTDQLRLQHSISIWNDYFRNTLLEESEGLFAISEAMDQVRKFVMSKPVLDPQSWLDYLWERIYINIIYIDRKDAPQYFADVNNKGLQLNRLDLLKAIIIRMGSDDQATTLLWQEMITKIDKLATVFVNTSKNNTPETIISWALYLFGYNQVIKTSNISESLKRIQDIDHFLNQTNQMLDIGYHILNDPDFIALKMVNNGNFIPAYLLIRTKHKMSKREAINYLFYRYLFEPVNNQKLADSFHKSLLQPLQIVRDYSLMNNIKYGSKKVKPFLCMLESRFNPNIFQQDLSAKSITIEHISSQSWGEEDYNNIGNLTLLTRSENSKLNKFQEKYPIYRDSEFNITKCLCQDYKPLDDSLRLFRSKYYCKGYTSQDLDAFSKEDFELRQKQLLDCLIKTLELEKYEV